MAILEWPRSVQVNRVRKFQKGSENVNRMQLLCLLVEYCVLSCEKGSTVVR